MGLINQANPHFNEGLFLTTTSASVAVEHPVGLLQCPAGCQEDAKVQYMPIPMYIHTL